MLCKKNSAGNLVDESDEGALGRVVSFDLGGPLVKWTTGNTVTVSFLNLNILTPPVNIVPLAEIL